MRTTHVPKNGTEPFVVDPAEATEGRNGMSDPTKHTQYVLHARKLVVKRLVRMPDMNAKRESVPCRYPYVTGTSVLAVKYKDGVMMAADTLGSYGSTKRYKSVCRIKEVGTNVMLGASGELSDFQHIQKLLDELTTEDFMMDDGAVLSPQEIFSYLQRVMYNRRNDFDPLWNSLVLAGVDRKGVPFLGAVGMIGQAYTDSHIATGFGNALARPLFRSHQKDDMSEAEAEELLKKALKVCYYRDKNSINKFQLAKVTQAGVDVSEPFKLETNWDYGAFVNPSKHVPGTW